MDKGGAKYLRLLVNEGGVRPLTRDELAEQLRVSPNTIDNWLDTNTHPLDYYYDRLARILAPRAGLDVQDLKSQLNRHYGLCALCDHLAWHLGRDATMDLSTALVRFTSRSHASLRKFSYLAPEDPSEHQLLLLLQGTQFEASKHLLMALRDGEDDSIWSADLLAASNPWYERLQYVAQYLGASEETIQSYQDDYGLSLEDAKRLLQRTRRDAQSDLDRPTVEKPSEPESPTVRSGRSFRTSNCTMESLKLRWPGSPPGGWSQTS